LKISIIYFEQIFLPKIFLDFVKLGNIIKSDDAKIKIKKN